MPDQPTPYPDEDEAYELLGTVAHLMLGSVEQDLPPDERGDPKREEAFEDGFRFGFMVALHSVVWRLTTE